MKGLFVLLICFGFLNPISVMSQADKPLPFLEIPESPQEYTATTVIARMIEGAGFRYYWATEGLRIEDLEFKPSTSARSCRETLDHIYGLSQTVLNATKSQVNEYQDGSKLSFEELRRKTLENFEKAAIIMRNDPNGDLKNYKIIFKRGEGTTEHPFWNLINGPIEDAAWHVGQVVSFRRSSGNPYNSKASLFSGKLRD